MLSLAAILAGITEWTLAFAITKAWKMSVLSPITAYVVMETLEKKKGFQVYFLSRCSFNGEFHVVYDSGHLRWFDLSLEPNVRLQELLEGKIFWQAWCCVWLD